MLSISRQRYRVMWKFRTRSVIQSVTIITANFGSFQSRSATAFGPFSCHSVPLQELVGLRRRYPVRHFKQSQEWHFPQTLEKQYMREQLRRAEIISLLKEWNRAWDRHDLEGVMNLFHEEIIFENWTGGNARGKEALRQAWEPWVRNHGAFRFVEEGLFIDEAAQKVLYQWTLEWPSPERGFEGKAERRRGLDVIHFRDGKIHRKFSKAKTTLEIEGKRVKLSAEPKAVGY